MKLCLGPLSGLLALTTTVAIGCSAEAPAGDPVEVASSEVELADVSCSSPRRYIAVLADEGCTEVVGERGRWVPSPLFEDAPVEASACVYAWSGRAGLADRHALLEHVRPFGGGALTASCGRQDERVGRVVELEPLPKLDIFILAGSFGCDVCGIVKGGKVWVVLPPEKVVARQFAVPLTDGSVAQFRIHADRDALALAFSLPPTVEGVDYVDGRIAVH